MHRNRNFIEAYTSTLNQQKKIIQTNTYARELELKYHKQRHHHYKSPVQSETGTREDIPQWPIENHVFNQVLKSKLQDITVKATPSLNYSKVIVKEIKQNMTTRLNSEEHKLPRIDKNQYWSPPRLTCYAVKTYAAEKNSIVFGPNIRQIKYSTKSI